MSLQYADCSEKLEKWLEIMTNRVNLIPGIYVYKGFGSKSKARHLKHSYI